MGSDPLSRTPAKPPKPPGGEDERRTAVEALDDLDDPRTIEPLTRVWGD
jgi:hypothetical protein